MSCCSYSCVSSGVFGGFIIFFIVFGVYIFHGYNVAMFFWGGLVVFYLLADFRGYNFLIVFRVYNWESKNCLFSDKKVRRQLCI